MATLVVVPFLISASYYINFLDYPSPRKVHKTPIPLSGGIIIFIITAVFSKLLIKNDVYINAIILGGFFIFILGLIDDFFNINALLKLTFQIIIVLFFLNKIDKLYFVNFFSNHYLNLFITAFWMLFVMNAINLIDGVDGLASGLSFIVFTSLASIAFQNYFTNMITFTLIFASSLMIFLRFNISPAKVFLGDSGSLYIGYVISAVSLYISSKSLVSYSFLLPVMFLLIPLLDVVRIAFNRLQQGKSIFQPDKQHIHHKLLEYGFSDRQVAILLYFISSFISFIALKNYSPKIKTILLLTVLFLYIALILIKLFQLFNFKKIVRYFNLRLRRIVRRLVLGSQEIIVKSKSLIFFNSLILILIFLIYLKFVLLEQWSIEKSIIFIITAMILILNNLLLNIDDTVKISSNFIIFWIYFYITYKLNMQNLTFLNFIVFTLFIINIYKIFIKHQFDLFIYNPFEILIIHTIAILLFSIKGIDWLLIIKTFIIYYSTKNFFSQDSKEYKIFMPFITIMILIGPLYYILFLVKEGVK